MIRPRLTIEKVVIADRRGREIAEVIGAGAPGLALRVVAPEELAQHDIDDTDAVVTVALPSGADISGLKWLHCAGAGIDGLIADRRWPPATLLTRTTGRLGEQIGEYCLAHMLAHRQCLRARWRDQERANWRQDPEPGLIAGTRALVVGAGSVGTAVARCLARNGVTVTLAARRARDDDAILDWPAARAGLDSQDWIILAAPLTAQTAGMIGRDAFSRCRGAVVINVGRGPLIDHRALLAALDDGRVGGAILDVFPVEPLPRQSPLWHHPKVTVTPHVAGLTLAADAADDFLIALDALGAGRRPKNAVDPTRGY